MNRTFYEWGCRKVDEPVSRLLHTGIVEKDGTEHFVLDLRDGRVFVAEFADSNIAIDSYLNVRGQETLIPGGPVRLQRGDRAYFTIAQKVELK